MHSYIIKRLLLIMPVMLITSLILFYAMRLIPGSIVDQIAGELSGYGAVDRAVIEQRLGLDAPLFTQYGRWMGFLPQADGSFGGLFQGDLGVSLYRNTPVGASIRTRWPITLQLSLMALLISQLIALPIGAFSALRQDTLRDYAARSFAIFCIAVPGFWLGTMLLVFPSIWWGYMPPIMHVPFARDPMANLQMFIVPALVLGMLISGGTMRMTRTVMLEVLKQDYIRTAWAKGFKERTVVVRHALRNAIIPIVTVVGLQVPSLIGGSVVIEEIFSLPGMGRLVLQSALRRDYPVVSGVMVFFVLSTMLINLVVDLLYGFLDPRIRY